jgi:hypothetical protein
LDTTFPGYSLLAWHAKASQEMSVRDTDSGRWSQAAVRCKLEREASRWEDYTCNVTFERVKSLECFAHE